MPCWLANFGAPANRSRNYPLRTKTKTCLGKRCFVKRKDCICRGMPSFLQRGIPSRLSYVLILSSCLYLALAIIAGRSNINILYVVTIAVIDISLDIQPIGMTAGHCPILGFTMVGCFWFRPGFNGGPTITSILLQTCSKAGFVTGLQTDAIIAFCCPIINV